MHSFVYLPGDDFQLMVTWAYDHTPINLTGYTASFKVDLITNELELTIGNGLTVNEAEGQIAVHIDHETTADWDSNFDFRLRVTSPQDIITTLLYGNLVVQHVIA